MSEQRQSKLEEFFVWATRGSVVIIMWFLAQIYYQIQDQNREIQSVKLKVSAIESNLDIIKNFDLKPKH